MIPMGRTNATLRKRTIWKPAASPCGRQGVFTAEQIRALVATARPVLKSMILLGINAGYGNTDCSKLPFAKLDLDGGWTTFARTRNAYRRRGKPWPETVEALRAWTLPPPSP